MNRFSLSFREVEDLLAERGIIVSYERQKSVQNTPRNAPPGEIPTSPRREQYIVVAVGWDDMLSEWVALTLP